MVPAESHLREHPHEFSTKRVQGRPIAGAGRRWRGGVGGHEILTVDGHESDHWRPRELTTGGHEN